MLTQLMTRLRDTSLFFFFNDTATTEIYTLSLHDALPISHRRRSHYCVLQLADVSRPWMVLEQHPWPGNVRELEDRKSTRLNSSHSQISYAVFCLKKKKKTAQDSVCTLAAVMQVTVCRVVS